MTTKLFVYGELRREGRLHNILESYDSVFIGTAKITSKDFVMRSLGSYPALHRVTQGSGDVIHGEVYDVTQDCLAHVDRIESGYNREQTRVDLDNTRTFVHAYIIPFNVNKWLANQPVIKTGDWMQPNQAPFRIEQSVCVISESGQAFGPYANVKEACERISEIAEFTSESVFTVGFRVYDTSLSSDDLYDIEQELITI